MSCTHSLGIACVTEGVLNQLRRKHPSRKHSVPQVMPGVPRADTHVYLTEQCLYLPGLDSEKNSAVTPLRNSDWVITQ